METSCSPSVLIVRPFPEHHTIIERLLTGGSWVIHHAASCREAAAFLAENEPDAIICERALPDGAWEDVLRHCLELRRKSGLIVSCRLADEHLWSEALSAGGFNVVAQPFDEEELRRIIELARRSSGPPA